MRISDWSSDVCSSDLPGERFAGDTLIPHAQRAGAARKADVIGRPVVADERRDQPAVAPRNVAVAEGPDVIAPDVAGFDQPHAELRPLRRTRERREPAGKPAADAGDVPPRENGREPSRERGGQCADNSVAPASFKKTEHPRQSTVQ